MGICLQCEDGRSPEAIALELLCCLATTPLAISQNLIDGVEGITKSGENPDIDVASGFEDIWDVGGTYIPPTQARIHDVVSGDAADAGTLVSSGTATGGSTTTLIDTGATFVTDGVVVGDYVLNDSNVELGIAAVVTETTITFLGNIFQPIGGMIGSAVAVGDTYRVVTNASTGASIWYQLGQTQFRIEQDEFIILNGLTDVPTLLSYARQYTARVFGPNTTGAVGIITSTAQTDGTISCQVNNGNNQTLMAIYSVPFDKNGYITKWWGSLSKKQTAVSTLKLRSGSLDGIGYVLQTRAIDNAGSSEFSYEYPNPRPIPGGADIWVEADTDTDNTGISSGFEITLVDKT